VTVAQFSGAFHAESPAWPSNRVSLCYSFFTNWAPCEANTLLNENPAAYVMARELRLSPAESKAKSVWRERIVLSDQFWPRRAGPKWHGRGAGGRRRNDLRPGADNFGNAVVKDFTQAGIPSGFVINTGTLEGRIGARCVE